MGDAEGTWNGRRHFGKHGLKMSMEKSEVMWVRQQGKEMNIRLEGRGIRQGNRFEDLGRTVTRDGKSEAEVRRRIQVGVNAC